MAKVSDIDGAARRIAYLCGVLGVTATGRSTA